MQNSVKKTRDAEGWRRCSEGFTDFLAKSIGANKNDRTRGKSSEPIANKQKETFTPGNIFEKLAFPTEETSQSIAWSSSENEEDKTEPEPVQPTKKRKKISPRLVSKRSKTTTRQEKEVVILSSSDTEKEDKAEKCRGESNLLNKKTRVKEVKEVVIISSSDTEKDEKSKETQDTATTLSQKSEVVSIHGYESDHEERGPSREKTPPPPSQDLYSQSSVTISTQSPADTQSGLGVKASDWVKSLQLKTPSKSEQPSTSSPVEDSAKKKKKHSRGGLAEQLTRLQNRDKSSVRVWKHQHGNLTASQDARSVSLRVQGFEYLYSLQLIRCRVVHKPENSGSQTSTAAAATTADDDIRLVMLSVSQAEQLKLQPGVIFKIYPPWQQLELSTGQQIMLCAKYCHVLDQSDSQAEQTVPIDQGKHQTIHAVWNCPCVQGLCTSQSLCPAYQFPCVPGYVQELEDTVDEKTQQTDNNSNTLKAAENKTKMAASSSSITQPSHTAQVKSHLHTVGLQSRGSKSKSESCDSGGSRVYDSILESIESVRSKGDNLTSLCFKGHVHKKAQIQEENGSKSYHLFVEDAVGTVCVIKLTNNCVQGQGIEEECIEGKTFQFTGLKVQDRTTRDRDPHLLSVVDKVWSGTAVNRVTSQDTQENSLDNKRTEKPSGFCYILDELQGCSVEMLPCLVDLHGDREVTTQTLSDISTYCDTCKRCDVIVKFVFLNFDEKESWCGNGLRREVTTQTLSDLSIHCDTCKRCDVVVKLIYLNFDEKKKQLLKSAYVIDHLLTRPVCVKYSSSSSHSSLTSSNGGQQWKLIRDLCVFNGELIVDDYTTIVNDADTIKAVLKTQHNQDMTDVKPTLDLITKQCNIQDIVRITGVISEIDEDSAYSWEVCKFCGSDQILVDEKTGSSKCNDCKQRMEEPDVRMKMEVIVNVANSDLKVKVDLLQLTIESLLPKDEADDEGYELSSVVKQTFRTVTLSNIRGSASKLDILYEGNQIILIVFMICPVCETNV